MTESTWSIKKGAITIYGVLNTAKKKNDRAIVHVHGLARGAYDFAATLMAQTLPQKGYDVIRICLYDWRPGARQLGDCTLAIHGDDITAVLKHFKKKYKKIFATGHSYGAPSLLFSDTKLLSAMAFWDGSIDPGFSFNKADKDKNYKATKYGWVFPWGTEPLIGSAMIKHSRSLTPAVMKKLAAKCKTPTLIAAAADGMLIDYPDKYIDWLTCEKKTVSISGTTHHFHEEGATQPLLRTTKAWFDKF